MHSLKETAMSWGKAKPNGFGGIGKNELIVGKMKAFMERILNADMCAVIMYTITKMA